MALNPNEVKVKLTPATVKVSPDKPLTPVPVKPAMLIFDVELNRGMIVPLTIALTVPVDEKIKLVVSTVVVSVSDMSGVKVWFPLGEKPTWTVPVAMPESKVPLMG